MFARRLLSTSASAGSKRRLWPWLVGGLGAAGVGVLLDVHRRTLPEHRPEHTTSAVTYYRSTLTEPLVERPALHGTPLSVDVCVVGGGFAGVYSAMGCVERGKSAVVLEAQQVGWGASGMNAGMALSGFMLEGQDLVDAVGADAAKTLFAWSLDAQQLLRRRIKQFNIACDVQDTGALIVSVFKDGEEAARADVTEWNKLTGSHVEVWSPDVVQSKYKTSFYHHGVFDPNEFAVNPLKLVLGMAKAAESKGVRIFENTEVVAVAEQTPSDSNPRRWRVTTKGGASVYADHVVLAGSAHLLPGVDMQVSSATVPILTYIMVTEPLGDKMQTVVRAPHMVFDDRAALSYFRPLPDGRLLWGGLAQVAPVPADELRDVLMQNMLRVFPQLEGTKAEYFWGGTLAFGMEWLPLIGQRKPGLWFATGFGGHGIVPTVLAGELVASAICENDQRWQMFAEKLPLKFVGGPVGTVVAELSWRYYRAMDEYYLWQQQRSK